MWRTMPRSNNPLFNNKQYIACALDHSPTHPMNRIAFTEETVQTAAESIRKTMESFYVPGSDFGVYVADQRITVDGWVSCKAAEIYESYGDNYFALRYHTGFMMFTRRVTYECEIAPLTEALIELFSCELVAHYILA